MMCHLLLRLAKLRRHFENISLWMEYSSVVLVFCSRLSVGLLILFSRTGITLRWSKSKLLPKVSCKVSESYSTLSSKHHCSLFSCLSALISPGLIGLLWICCKSVAT